MIADSRFIRLLPVLIIVLLTLLFANLQTPIRSGGNNACWNISGDGRGYYAWLPAIFIYHDLNFGFTDTVEKKVPDCGLQNGMPVQEYRYCFGGKQCDKYYPGASLLMLPFFTIAHFYTGWFTTLPANGYSFYYFRIMALAGIFYYLIGMLFFLGILKLLKLNNLQQVVCLLLVTFGSNIIYYTIDTPVWSHIYSYTLITAFVYYVLRLKVNPAIYLNAKNLVIISLLIGIILITRPVDAVVVLLIPVLLWADRQMLVKYFADSPLRILFLFPGIIWIIILLTIYKISTGNYFLYSYKNEGFNFAHPHLWQFLFHYDNGILPYTPLFFMPFLFMYAWYKKQDKSLIIGATLVLALVIYINSSWWFWAFGLSFGSRTMLDFLALWGIPIALSVKNGSQKSKFILIPAYILCCSLTMILYNQKSAHGYMCQLSAHITDYWEALSSALNVK